MAYVFNKSTPATAGEALFNLKACLKAAGWTAQSSGDGLTYFAASDGITHGGTGAGGMGNSRAWFRLRDPADVVEFMFQRGSGALEDMDVWISRSARFTGGAPDATTVPTATDGVSPWATNPVGKPFFAASGTYRWNVGADNAAPYAFWAAAFPNGGGNPNAAFVYERFEAHPSDASPILMYVSSTAGPGTPFSAAPMIALSVAFRDVAYSFVPSAVAGAGGWYVRAMQYYNGSVVVPGGLPTSPITSKDEVFPIPWAIQNGGTSPGWKGVGTVMKWVGTSRSTGDTLNVAGTRDRIIYRDVSLPWDGSVPTV